MDKEEIEYKVAVGLIIVLGAILFAIVYTSYDKYSYQKGYFDGVSDICKVNIVIDQDTKEVFCADINELRSLDEIYTDKGNYFNYTSK